MRMLSDSQAIFQQLAETTGDQGVNVIIENHDALGPAAMIWAMALTASRRRLQLMA